MGEVSRRQLLRSGGAGVAGAAIGVAGDRLTRSSPPALDAATQGRLAPYDLTGGDRALPAGLADAVPAFGHVLAARLKPGLEGTKARGAAVALFTSLTELADGRAVPAMSAGLDVRPSSLQVTPGVGASLLARTGLQQRMPSKLIALPAFAADRLDPALSGGDVMVQLGADDPMRLAAAVQAVRAMLAGDWRIAWARPGFRVTPAGARDPRTTARNLMGHRDGTGNPEPGSPLWESAVVSRESGWMSNGSYVVARQIRIDLDRWYAQAEDARDRVIGRRTADGAALGQRREADEVDLGLRSHGSLVVPPHAHIRLAGPNTTLGARIYRRSWNFDDGEAGGTRAAGLMFMAWQADLGRGFIPIQRSLDRGHDALSAFVTHIGSAVFAAPARGDDDYVGQRLLA